MLRTLALCLPFVAGVGLPSQTVHLVGPGGLPQIRDALAIAAPGDVVHVQPGTYAHFDAAVGVTVRGLVPGTVTIAYDPAYAPANCAISPLSCTGEGPTSLRPPAGQMLHLVDLDFAPSQPGASYGRHGVLVSSGRVTFDRCTLRAYDRPALAVGSATVHLQDCLVQCLGSPGQPAPGLWARSSDITATDCRFPGTPAAAVGVMQFPQPGIRLQASRLHGSNLEVSGGQSVFPGTLAAPALQLDAASAVWLSDSTLTAGRGECALETGGGSVRLDRCTLTSAAPPCPTGTTSPFLLGVERPAPLLPGATFTLRYRTQPNGFVVVLASFAPGTVDWGPLLEQPSWFAQNSSFGAGIYGADATGLATASWPIPGGPYADLSLWFMGVSGSTLPLQVSPPVGGVVR